MNEFDETEEYENLPEEFGGPSKRAKITWKILRVVGWVIFCTVLGILFSRMCSTANDPKSVSTITPNDKLVSVYQNGELNAYTQNLDQFTTEYNNYGYFAITSALVIPDAEQIQIVFRYNVSTLEELAKDYPDHFKSTPNGSEDLFDITLVKVIDLTPDNSEDNTNEEKLRYERYFPTSSTKDSTSRHRYERFVFDGINCDDALEVYVSIYYKGDLDYEKDDYGSVQIYTSDPEKLRRKYILSSADKKAIDAFIADKSK